MHRNSPWAWRAWRGDGHIVQLPLWDPENCAGIGHRWDFLHHREGRINDRIILAVFKCRFCRELSVREVGPKVVVEGPELEGR